MVAQRGSKPGVDKILSYDLHGPGTLTPREACVLVRQPVDASADSLSEYDDFSILRYTISATTPPGGDLTKSHHANQPHPLVWIP